MTYRYDINGLRAIAVIGVVLYHFDLQWLSGGFAGVDVFFVISGFLMTGIIIRGLEREDFNLFKFYVAKANRIVPALFVLCLTLIVLGWFFLIPHYYEILARHIASSLSFVSNITFWQESGYFDAGAKEKWLLHTWSLSVEWQFYILYPIALLVLSKVVQVRYLGLMIVAGTVLGYGLSIYGTANWPQAAYFMLPTRAWEMMLGGVAFLYSWRLSAVQQKILERIGLLLIVSSYFIVTSVVSWPGYAALVPVLGTYLVIIANRQDSVITNNRVFQLLGKWSYSIYLWHWPVVVFGYYIGAERWWVYGIPLSILLGFVSYQFIERYKLPSFSSWRSLFRVKPLYMTLLAAAISMPISIYSGAKFRVSSEFNSVFDKVQPSPFRDACHISSYQSPSVSCEYFSENIKWAVFGDSHGVELAYALAGELQKKNEGVKHLTFSGCRPAYAYENDRAWCSKWYNEAVNYIAESDEIEYVVFSHRYDGYIARQSEADVDMLLDSINRIIMKFAEVKKEVYVLYPVPVLQRSISTLLAEAWLEGSTFSTIAASSLADYKHENMRIINLFENSQYPAHVKFIKPADAFCSDIDCFAAFDGVPLYFDDDHPSVSGAKLLVMMIINKIVN